MSDLAWIYYSSIAEIHTGGWAEAGEKHVYKGGVWLGGWAQVGKARVIIAQLKRGQRRKEEGGLGVKGSNFKVAVDREGFGKEVGKVKKRGNVREVKQALTDSITEPVESHVH
jgi:hypothetical protein